MASATTLDVTPAGPGAAATTTVGGGAHGGHSTLVANRIGLWLFMCSETFLFAAGISARFVLVGTKAPDELNQALALLLTGVLLASSISAYLGEVAIAHDDRRRAMLFIWLTVLLGAVFMGGVTLEWDEAIHNFPPGTTYGSVFFLLIGLHSFHVVTGILGLAIVLGLVRRGRFGSDDHWAPEAVIKYWHFVDLAWVVIYPTLYLVR